MPDHVTTKSPLKTEKAVIERDPPSLKGPLIEVTKLDGGNISPIPCEGFGGQGPYADPKASRPGKPTIADADIKPIRHEARKTIVAVLEGGILDGIEVDVDPTAMEHQAQVKRDPSQLEPFEFDGEAHALWVRTGGKEGKPNIVHGEHDTITYKRTNRKSPEGFVIFAA